jgi:hypothetical protein
MKQVSTFLNSLVPGRTKNTTISKLQASNLMLVILPALFCLIIIGCKKNDLKDSMQTNNLISNSLRKIDKTRCVPFKASFTTMDEMTQAGTDTNPIQKDHLTGTGVGTGIGKASIEVFAEGDITLPFPALVTSTATFTAANGDKIFETSEGYVQEPAPDAVLLHLSGKGTITGGTGRFAGATGSLSFNVTQNMLDPKGAVTFDGTICY